MSAVDSGVNLTESPALPSLWRNKAFNLLWGGHAVSTLGTSMSQLALPLLTLGITGSPIKAGIVGTTAAVVRLAAYLPAGVITDRLDRRKLLLVSDAVRLAAFALLAWLVLTDRVTLGWIIAVAVIAAPFNVAHDTAQASAIRNVVPLPQIPDARARNEGTEATIALIGPPIGGALYGVARGLPFVADAISYLLSFIGAWLIRQPTQQERTEPHEHPVKELIEGVRFTLSEPFLRAMLLIAALLNLAFNGLAFAVIVILQQRGTPPELIGITTSVVFVGVLCGALIAPWLARKVPLRRLVVGMCWIAAAVIAAGSLLTGSILISVPMVIAILGAPAINAAFSGYQAARTPDRLQGRVISVADAVGMALASVSALLTGALFTWFGGPGTILAFAAVIAVSALVATFSKGMRSMRPLTEMGTPA